MEVNDNLFDEELDIDLIEQEEAAPTPIERLRFTTDKRQEPIRVDKFVMHRVEGATRNKIQQAIDDGLITVDGKVVKTNFKIKGNMEIVYLENRRPERTEIVPEPMGLNIVYEDNSLMVINKPAGVVVHPGSGNYTGTLVNGIAYYLNPEDDKYRTIDLPRVGLVHRIDKDTSGLLLIAKTEEAMQFLAAQFKAHTVYRRYVALAWGDFMDEEGTITGNVGRNLRFRKMMDVFPEGDYGKMAITHYKVLERFLYVSLLEFRLETGRTHQIRVHTKSIGHPLFNDSTYGGDRIVKGTIYTKYKQFVDNCFKILPRQALHAKELGFIHPETKAEMRFNSDIPQDMEAVVEKWRKYAKETLIK